ncbi:aldehyde dehydrogenase (NADP(+)) [Kitasatospora sp. NPDC048296]|uniref:aldehyde dehydrogenase (NADP(+)) n=1 Tax=Kitasatospora sp. NPDC048296 TaxID=3364048 RepID=UPI00371C5AFE
MTHQPHVQGYDPRTGEPAGDPVPADTPQDVDRAVTAARQAGLAWAALPGRRRAEALEAVADALDAARDTLAAVADTETALGLPRLTGEIARTTGQLRMFADAARTGAFADAILTPADPATGRPDIRRMQHPVGPVAVFTASNFPFAFSVAGGDTASALAAGCPVVVKAHEAHPHTSLATAAVVTAALEKAGAPHGLLQLVFGREAGAPLVTHPAIKAAGFTGSLAGGRALFDLTQQRSEPIPFYGELGSANPVVVLPGAARERTSFIAQGFAASLTLGTGQFCTNPGLLFVPEDDGLLEALAAAVGGTTGGPMLSERIRDGYRSRTDQAPSGTRLLATGSAGDGAWAVTPTVWRTTLDAFRAHAEELAEETFGPASVVVTYREPADLAPVLATLPGSLTASIHAADTDLDAASVLTPALRERAGRLVFNGWPTGVAVSWAMHHGGPWPATTAAGFTSVGLTAARRWLTPVAYQDWPHDLLPPELQDANPLGIQRLREERKSG